MYVKNVQNCVNFAKKKFAEIVKNRALNVIFVTLEKLMVRQIIVNDRDDLIERYKLDLFTVAQIQSFIYVANDSNSTKSKAVLLNYKNEKYPHYTALQEFSLDL